MDFYIIKMGRNVWKRSRMNRSILTSLIVLVFLGFFVSRVKYEVVFLKDELKKINSKIEKCEDDIRVYNAEWSYLNDPDRLKKLCAKHLPNLRPTDNRQMISYKTIVESDLGQNAVRAFGSFLDDTLQSGEGSGE